MNKHNYHCSIEWTGNRGEGTSSYRRYSRDHEISIEGKPTLLASSDPTFLGDDNRFNPEELLVASLSSCHMLWFLHICSTQSIRVVSYTDQATGVMTESEDGSGRFESVTLNPSVQTDGPCSPSTLTQLHREAHAKCFIANSVNFPVHIAGQE